jgi:hypothetical protein
LSSSFAPLADYRIGRGGEDNGIVVVAALTAITPGVFATITAT